MYKIPLGPFELHEPVGKGGMGEVWRGRHVRQGVDVAVKVLTREGLRREEYRDAFDTEVRAVARLDHPGIIVMLDHGELSEEAEAASHHRLAAGSPFLVMEFARFGSLHDFRDTLRWPELREVLFTILDALAHAHARGVIHRDLKPQNILLGTGDLDAVKLTDFGLAHATFDHHEREDLVEEGWGTPQYMAPEQFRGRWRDYGPWTDLYALGCMTYELLTGQVPYQGTSSWELGRAHVLEPVPRLVPRFEAPDGLEEWVLRLLQKVPHERFVRAADAALALARLGGPTEATPGVIITGDFRSVSAGLRATYERHAVLTERARAGLAIGGGAPDTRDTQPEESPTEQLPALQDVTLEAGVPPSPAGSSTREGVFQFQRSRSVLDWDAYAAATGEASEGGVLGDMRSTAETLLLPVPVLTPPLVPTWRPRYVPHTSRSLVGAGLGLYGMRELRVIEREAERDLLWEILRDVHVHGQPRAVVVRGQSGIGKTRLVRWMGARAHELGAAATLTATHSATPTASDGIGPMLARHLRVTGLDRDHTQERLAVELHRHGLNEPHQIIALADLLAPAPVAADAEADAPGRFLSHQASTMRATLRHLLAQLTTDRPLIITLEDVQWGAEALLLAHYLLTHTAEDERLPVLLLLTVRDDALAPEGAPRRILDELLGMQRVYACPLSPLSEEATARLVGELLGLEETLTAQVVARAGGVPQFAVELVGDWVARGKLEVGQRGFMLRAGEAADIPDSLHTMWQGRLHRAFAPLPPAARLTVEIAAALGNEVRAVEWVEACRQRGLPVERVWLSTLRRAGLIRKTPDGWRFAHHTMRESMERDARDGERWTDHHMACARMLTALHGAQPPRGYHDRISRHLLAAEEWRGAVDPLLRAAQELLNVSELTLALERLDQREGVLNRMALSDQDSRWALGWVMRAQVLDLLGRSPEAAQWAGRAVDQASAMGWRELYVVAAIQQGFAMLHRGTTRGAEAQFGSALEFCKDAEAPTAERAHARIGLARVAQRMGQLDRAEALFEQARAECEALHDRRLLATCYNGLGDIARQRGAWAEAHQRSERAYHLTRELGDRVLMADCINDLGELYRLMGNLDDAARLCERAAKLYESIDSQQSKRAWMNLAYVHLSKRSFREAEELLRPLVQHFRTHQDDGQLTMAMMGVMPCLAARDDWEAFDRALDWVRRLLFTTGRRDADVTVVMDLCIPMLQAAGRHDTADLLDELRDRYGPRDADD